MWKQAVKYVAPPVLIDLARWIRDRVLRRLYYEWEYIPEGWSAERIDPKIKGWNAQGVLETYKAKRPAFLASIEGTRPLGVSHESRKPARITIVNHNTTMSFAYALALAAWRKSSISMLDWGGGIGHYYLIGKTLLPELQIEYHCKDMPVLIEHERTLFPEACFYADETCLARRYDFVLASSSLQYSEDWCATLGALAGCTDAYLFVTRLPVVQHSAAYVLIQRPYQYGYDTEYFGWCLNQQELVRCAEAAGLALVREFVIGERHSVRGAPEPYEYRGFLFHRRGER